MNQAAPEQISSILRRVEGNRLEMMCPRCDTWADAALGFKNLQIVKAKADDLNPIVKCMNKDCGHTFSPRWLILEAS